MFWTATLSGDSKAKNIELCNYNGFVNIYTIDKKYGLAVRCIKDN